MRPIAIGVGKRNCKFAPTVGALWSSTNSNDTHPLQNTEAFATTLDMSVLVYCFYIRMWYVRPTSPIRPCTPRLLCDVMLRRVNAVVMSCHGSRICEASTAAAVLSRASAAKSALACSSASISASGRGEGQGQGEG